MGLNISKQKQNLTSIIKNASEASCKSKQNTTQEIKGLQISLVDSNCKDIQILNRAKLASQCDLGVMSKALANASMGLSANQTATLGLAMNINTSEQERSTIIENEIKAECGSDQKVKQTIQDAVISLQGSNCNDIKVINDLDATSQCVLKLALDAVDQQEAQGTTTQTVKFPIGLSIGIGLGVVGLVIVAIVLIMVMKGGKKGQAARGEAVVESGYTDVSLSGGRRRSRRRQTTGCQINWKNVPITVLGILMLVWYAKMTEPK